LSDPVEYINGAHYPYNQAEQSVSLWFCFTPYVFFWLQQGREFPW